MRNSLVLWFATMGVLVACQPEAGRDAGAGGGTTTGGGTATTGGGTATGGGAATGDAGAGDDGGTSDGGRPGETCANAEVIAVGSFRVGDLAGYQEDSFGSSCMTPGADRFYRFTLPVRARISLGVTSTAPDFVGMVALFDAQCSGLLACSGSRDAGDDFGVRDPNIDTSRLPAGEYVVVVKGAPAGAWTLGVVLDATGGGATLCQAMEAGSRSLRNALLRCPAGGDEALYGFNRPGCDARAAAKCTQADEDALRQAATCERLIEACMTAADRARVQAAISQCTAGLTVSSQCMSSLR